MMISKEQLQKDLIAVLNEEIDMIKARYSQKIVSEKLKPLIDATFYLIYLDVNPKAKVETVKLAILDLGLARRFERAIMEYIRRAYESYNDC